MKFLIVLSMAALAVAAELYPTDHDDLDVEEVVANDDLLLSYNTCFTNRAPCGDIPAFFKQYLPESFEQACAKCTQAQKHIMRRFVEGLKQKYPEELGAFFKQFDPENKYTAALAAAIADA
ncbi:insect pheromone-binding family, a10/OS-D domain-containing protein [Phthorimaea operculella]|nr:insect pheromone-binding family, a10/OS-D domain-containing protein [Phthorimaea operculella]